MPQIAVILPKTGLFITFRAIPFIAGMFQAEYARKYTFLTLMNSPHLMVCEGLTLEFPMVTRPFLHASAAIERVLKIRAAHSHLSMRAVGPVLGS